MQKLNSAFDVLSDFMTGMSLSKLVERTRKRLPHPVKRQIKNIAYRSRLKLLTSGSNLAQEPHDLFRGIGDGFWFWLNTEGCGISPTLRNILPTMPAEDVQLGFTGDKGNAVMSVFVSRESASGG